MAFNIRETANEHILIMAHRGVSGGNIPCNTLASYEIALKQGADIIETDLEMTADGKLVIFHPGKEVTHLGYHGAISALSWSEAKQLRYLNCDGTSTQFGIETFDDLLEQFKGRCYINVDKFWGHPEEIYRAIKRHNMQEQILAKSAPSRAIFDMLEELAPDLPYMTILRAPLCEEIEHRNINYIGAEVVFGVEDHPLASQAYIDEMHKKGKLVLANAIIYDYLDQIAAGHSDDTALTSGMDEGWGWLADRGFDIIQTDWTGMLFDYLKSSHKYYKS